MQNFNITYDEILMLLHKACTSISADALALMNKAVTTETNQGAKALLASMIENVSQAGKLDKPVCQSPGFPTVYIRFGDNVQLADLTAFLPKAVIECTKNGYIRPSIVHPLTRHNSGDSSGIGVPNMEYRYCPGQEYMEVIMSAKGCGAELANQAKILTPATLGTNYVGLKKLVLDTVVKGGGFPCPPSAIGIGIGGQMDVSAKLSREAISTRDWRDTHPDPLIAGLEQELLQNINELGLGPAGIGGDTTCLAVKIGYAATHTAICPVTINFHCWVARRFGVRFYPNGRREYLFQEEM
ncbi:fumarate hydratase [Sporomusa acidovorans]|uniref:L(+)-tartrate dehydratase subunit alpha n=1 Tax=Sporomusa acidovorans (strain ATCC 49682 / DSM 3132 / Mol) TaxID=1123286 RepID=A0ABZ3J6T2_SPOA4|nr:fumarate hydratase [Sporomusa acidovorans]OZC21023.1 L(+)-tartrate dehydratase subunit alpha [Sporomusa acidovorans DSM 3132]SDF18060.1 fumarate hydratase subunit alpha [Sporomusa acidovorans]